MPQNDEFHDIAGDWPLRPTTPDFERLREVVAIVEQSLQPGSHGWSKNYKMEKLLAEMLGVKPTGPNVVDVFNRFIDVVSATYMGTQRAIRNAPAGLVPGDKHQDLIELMTNTWMDGVFFGILFQTLGGHRDEGQADQK